jgi:arylsulfatase
MKFRILRTLGCVLAFSLGPALVPGAQAQEVLPRPEQPFKGHIGRTVKDSTQDFPKEVQARWI